jgi:uncharacterized protein (PEP-CTERM system associated)
MATAARKWRVAAGFLVLGAANAAAQYAPGAPAPGTVPSTPGERREASTDSASRAARSTSPWAVTTSIDLRGTYSDNVFVESETPRSDFVTQVTPGIRVDGRSPRLAAHLSYAPSALFYSRNTEANDVANFLDAAANLEAVERFFFLEGSANVSQGFITPAAAQPTELVTITQNRVETRTASVSPYVRREGRDLEYELRNRNTWTNSDRDELGKFRTRQWTGHVAGPVRRFGWSLEFDDITITHDDATVNRPEDKSTLYRGRLHWQAAPALRLSVSGGSEENNYILQQEQRTDIYGAALAWRPSPRTSADLEYEHRFFGPYKLARFTHRTRLTAWNLTYSRNTSTYQEEILRLSPGNTTALLDEAFAGRVPDPAQRAAAVEQFQRATGTPASLTNSLAFYTQRVYVREFVEASFAIIGVRNSITFTAFAADNSEISADALGALPDALLFATRIKHHGFGAHADHRLTPLTSISANATRINSKQEEPADFATRDDYVNLRLTYTASRKTYFYAGVSLSRFHTDNPAFSPNWDANSVFAGLNHRF